MTYRGKSLAEVEKELARHVLLRANPYERTHLISMEQLAAQIGSGLSTVREAVQRFAALGLVYTVPGSGLMMEPLHLAESAALIELRLRIAYLDEPRMLALRHYVDAMHLVLCTGIVATLDQGAVSVARMADELREYGVSLQLDGKRECAAKLKRVILHAGLLSDEIALQWAANGLYRSFDAVSPWLTAALTGRDEHAAWASVLAKFKAAERVDLAAALEQAVRPFCARVLKLSSQAAPDPGRFSYETDPLF